MKVMRFETTLLAVEPIVRVHPRIVRRIGPSGRISHAQAGRRRLPVSIL